MTDRIKEFRDLGLVLDFIHLESAERARWGGSNDSTVEAIKQTCEATGGEYVKVSNYTDFEVKFIAAADRKLLPPPSAQ